MHRGTDNTKSADHHDAGTTPAAAAADPAGGTTDVTAPLTSDAADVTVASTIRGIYIRLFKRARIDCVVVLSAGAGEIGRL